jgi:hypothetical protein
MTRHELPGVPHLDALPSGEFAGWNPSAGVVHTHLGDIPTLGDIGPGDVRVTKVNGFQFVGQASDAVRGATVRWNPALHPAWNDPANWFFDPRVPWGHNAVAFDRSGMLIVATESMHLGSNGIRCFDYVTGAIVTGDATYASTFGLAEYTPLGDGLFVGLNNVSGPGLAVWDGTTIRPIVQADIVGYHANRDGDNVCLSFIQAKGQPAVILQSTMTELRALPVGPPAIVAIGRPLWLGWFTFGAPTDAPGNCRMIANVGDDYFRDVKGNKIYHFVAGQSDGDFDQLKAAIVAARKADPVTPILSYVTRNNLDKLPSGADVEGLDAYLDLAADETIENFEARLRLSANGGGSHKGRRPRVAFICQAFDTNAALTNDLVSLPPIYARVAHDLPNVEALLAFSDGDRNEEKPDGTWIGGWTVHPEIHAEWHALYSGIPGAPALPSQPPVTPPAKPPVKPTPPTPELIGGSVQLPAGSYAVSYPSGTLTFTPIATSGQAAPAYPDFEAALEQVRAARKAKGQGPDDGIDAYRLLVGGVAAVGGGTAGPMDVASVIAAI